MKEELLFKDIYELIDNEELSKNPYKHFKQSRFILRSFKDETYPEVCDDSNWCRNFMYDFHERGILVCDDATLGTTARINNKNKEWYLESYNDSQKFC